jgi:hypothetical protein
MTNLSQSQKLEALIEKSGIQLPHIVSAGPGDRLPDYCNYIVQSNLTNVLLFNHDFIQKLFPAELDYELMCSKCEGLYNWWDKEQTKKFGFPPSRYCSYDGTKLKKVIKGNVAVWWSRIRHAVVEDDPIDYLYRSVFNV